MAAAPSSPVSDLSALNSEDFDEDANRSRSEHEGTSDAFDDNDSAAALPPTKRRRTAKGRVSRPRNHSPANSATGANGPVKHAAVDPDADPDVDMDGYGTDVSSDSSGMGSVDGSSALFKELGMNDEHSYGEEQVQVCRWDYCEAGDLGNQDELVKHINDVHVAEAKQRSFMCEWFDCKAKFRPQMSAYALRAHLRSHTKEKPFFCTLPECDRSFTRSDALAKHMRTVHETEGTRTVEHYNVKKSKPGVDGANDGSTQGDGSKGDGASSKPPQKLKLVFNNKSSAPSTPQHATANGASDTGDEEVTAPAGPLSPGTRDNLFGPLPESLQFTEAEAQMPRDQLFRLLRRQLRWADQESEELAKEIEDLEKAKRQEWLSKELVLENVMEAEYSRARRRGVFDATGQDSTFGEMEELDWADKPMSAQEKARILEIVDNDIEIASALPMKATGPQPWYRQQAEVEAEARARAAAAAKAKAEARAQADQQDDEEEEVEDDEEDEEEDDDGADGADGDAQEDEDMDDEDEEAEAPQATNEEDEDEDEDENETKVVIMTLGPGGGSGPTSVANDGDETEEDETL